MSCCTAKFFCAAETGRVFACFPHVAPSSEPVNSWCWALRGSFRQMHLNSQPPASWCVAALPPLVMGHLATHGFPSYTTSCPFDRPSCWVVLRPVDKGKLHEGPVHMVGRPLFNGFPGHPFNPLGVCFLGFSMTEDFSTTFVSSLPPSMVRSNGPTQGQKGFANVRFRVSQCSASS